MLLAAEKLDSGKSYRNNIDQYEYKRIVFENSDKQKDKINYS